MSKKEHSAFFQSLIAQLQVCCALEEKHPSDFTTIAVIDPHTGGMYVYGYHTTLLSPYLHLLPM